MSGIYEVVWLQEDKGEREVIKKAEWNVSPNGYRAGQGKWEKRSEERKGRGEVKCREEKALLRLCVCVCVRLLMEGLQKN